MMPMQFPTRRSHLPLSKKIPPTLPFEMMDFAAMWKHLFFFLQIHEEICREKSFKRRRDMTRSQNLLTSHYGMRKNPSSCGYTFLLFIFRSFLREFPYASNKFFFSFVDIRRERRTRGMRSALRYQICQPIVVSATLELEGETSLYTE